MKNIVVTSMSLALLVLLTGCTTISKVDSPSSTTSTAPDSTFIMATDNDNIIYEEDDDITVDAPKIYMHANGTLSYGTPVGFDMNGNMSIGVPIQ